ncbi:uncharacterized protein LOC143150989 [Ptiloglossa arizonensis]|uniref:uncharacterized protein LOC143150989 n=1 Tax=Ptiloglossa arizonensis TaxID=3350558 RepID=UPI003FA17AF8
MGVLGTKGILRIGVLIVAFSFDSSVALPAEQPTRFTLSTGDETSKDVASTTRFDQGRTLASESRNNVATAIAAKTSFANQGQRSLEPIDYSPGINAGPASRETTRLETEGAQSLLERPVSKPAAGILESWLKPTPLLDGIAEREKYGNSGDKFIGIGRALVSGFEGFSNFLNAVVDLPRNAAKKTSRGITEALNHVGARLIGLE